MEFPDAPAIYVRSHPLPLVSGLGRLWAAAISVGCLGVLVLASYLPPNHEGVGTHTFLGLNRCQFLQRTGLPCPSCGMTTAFSMFMHGHIATSFYVQPFGALLVIAALVSLWGGAYVAITGRPIYRLGRVVRLERLIIPILMFGVAAWGWKIFIHLTGHDGF